MSTNNYKSNCYKCVLLNILYKIFINYILNMYKNNLLPINYDSLKTVINSVVIELGIPAAFVQLQTPQGSFTFSFGCKNDDYLHFRIASNTKTMVAAVIVQLAQEHRIKFTDSASKYLPFVPKNITINNLLQMRSGLYNYTDSPIIAKTLDTNPTKVWTTRELLRIAFSQPPLFPPGTKYMYSNTNYLLLGLIIEKIEKKQLAKSFQERLFNPLKLYNTLLPDSNKIPKPYSKGYIYISSRYALVDKPYTVPDQLAAREGKLKPNNVTFQSPSYALAAGGVISNAKDMVKWIKSLATGKLFNKEYYKIWLNSFIGEYGYGIDRLVFGPNTMLFHGGEMPATILLLDMI
jgi:CubicO group peptidase (beta-lactamase class C family)